VKINLTRHNLYVIIITLILLLSVLLFSFLVLIPEGQEYRMKRLEWKKTLLQHDEYQSYHDEVFAELKNAQHENKNTINGLKTPFDASRFEKEYKSYFTSLMLSPLHQASDENNFSVYEVNTTSKISTPKHFYQFLDAVNKSDWIIGVNFPITFVKDGEMIRSSFTMKVYANKPDTNASTSASK